MGYPTPNSIPATSFCRRISIPDTPEWIGVVTGALLQLTEASNWDEVGTVTPDEAAAASLQMLNEYFDANGCPTDLDPPYWDTPENVDDDTDPDLYPWYDQLGDWLIAGFLAITFTPATGVTYLTSIPKARLAFRKGEFGASLRILLDGLEAFVGDTEGDPDELLEVNLDFAEFAAANDLGAGPWTMRVEHTGLVGERLEIIRKDLRQPNLRSIYGNTPPTFDEIAADYEAEYGVPLVPIELQQVAGQLQYRYSSTSAWMNVPNADNVRKDGSVAMTGGLEITPVSNEVNLTVKPHPTQNVAVVEVFGADQNSKTRFASDGAIYNEVGLYINLIRSFSNNWGYLALGNTSANAHVWLNKTAQPSRVSLVVSGAPSQTANLQNWINNGVSDIVASISAGGAATFRSQMKLQGLSSTATARDMAILYTVFADNIDSQRRAKVVLAPYYYGGNQDAVAAEAHPSGVRLKFYDALSPVVKQTVTGERQANAALASLLDALEAVGLIVDSTTVGTAPIDSDELDNALSPYQQNKCRYAVGIVEVWYFDHLKPTLELIRDGVADSELLAIVQTAAMATFTTGYLLSPDETLFDTWVANIYNMEDATPGTINTWLNYWDGAAYNLERAENDMYNGLPVDGAFTEDARDLFLYFLAERTVDTRWLRFYEAFQFTAYSDIVLYLDTAWKRGLNANCVSFSPLPNIGTESFTMNAPEGVQYETNVRTWNTVIGQEYTIEVSGTLNLGGDFRMDALYGTSDVWATHSDTRTDFYFIINGLRVSGEKPYSTGHSYTITRIGDGDPLEFQIFDVSTLPNNSGSFSISITGAGVP